MSHSAEPTEDEDTEEEEEEPVSKLPDYDLPTKRNKTDLEKFTNQEPKKDIKSKGQAEISPADWDKLPAKDEEKLDEKVPIVLGKGTTSGKPKISTLSFHNLYCDLI